MVKFWSGNISLEYSYNICIFVRYIYKQILMPSRDRIRRKRNNDVIPHPDEFYQSEKGDTVKSYDGKVELDARSVDLAYHLNLLGARKEDIAFVFGVDTETLNRWRKRFPEFDKAFRRGGLIADAKAAFVAYQVATGEYEQEVEEPRKNDNGEWEIIRYTKRYKPDKSLLIKWLASRQPETWSDKSKTEHSHTVTHKNINEIKMEGFTEQERELLFKSMDRQLNEVRDNNQN